MAAIKKAKSSNTYCRDSGLFSHLQSISKKVEDWPPEKRTAALSYIRSRYVRSQPLVKKQEL